jgi:phosphatidylglycerophosphatase A
MRLKLRPGSLPEGLAPSHPAVIAATWFGSGFAPMASGTCGSLAALPFAWLVASWGGTGAMLAATLALTLLGVWASGVIVTRGEVRDPGLIVIDEVAGMFLTLAFVAPSEPIYVIGFVLFRIADIVKPFPADWCDRNVHGGLGVMLDDLVAAIYAALATWLAATYLPLDVLATRLGL